MKAKRLWCAIAHVPFWKKYEIVEATQKEFIGRIFGACMKCGEHFRLWPAKYDPGVLLREKRTRCLVCERKWYESPGTVYCGSQHGQCPLCFEPRCQCHCLTSSVQRSA